MAVAFPWGKQASLSSLRSVFLSPYRILLPVLNILSVVILVREGPLRNLHQISPTFTKITPKFAHPTFQWTAKGASGKEPRQKASKIVKKCQKYFRNFSTFFAHGQKTSKIVNKCHKYTRHFLTIFARHPFSGPFWGALNIHRNSTKIHPNSPNQANFLSQQGSSSQSQPRKSKQSRKGRIGLRSRPPFTGVPSQGPGPWAPLFFFFGKGVGKQGCGNRRPIDERNPIRKFSIDCLDGSKTND